MTLRARLTAAFVLVVLVPLLVVVVLITTALPAAVADRQEAGLTSGARLWIGRAPAARPGQPPRWFLHGYLP